MNCPLCSGAAIRSFTAVAQDVPGRGLNLSLKECLGCGLAWQWPRSLTIADSIEGQSRGYAEQTAGTYYDPERRRAVTATQLAFVEMLCSAPGSLLDVGAGDGAFIAQAAARGWNCVGVDPAARQDPGLRQPESGSFVLVRGTLENLDAAQRHDVITMWDVIEHLDDPAAVLDAAVPMLKDSGTLIVETGNYHSADRITAGENWWAYAADHRWYFSPPTLRDLLRRCGLPHVALWRHVLRPWWHGEHIYSGPGTLWAVKRIVRSPMNAFRILRQFQELKTAASQWREWAGLAIVTVVASRQPIRARGRMEDLIELS